MPRYRTKPIRKAKAKQSRLFLWLVLAGTALVLFAAWAIFQSNTPTKANIEVNGAPRLKVEQDSIDHGDVRLGTLIRDTVRITNVGDQPLLFTETPYIEVKEGCWPPTPDIGSMALQPGQSTVITMEYMMHGDMGGPHDFRLHLKTNDETQPDKEIALLSNWVP